MITTDVSRAEFTSNGVADDYVFNDGTVDIPVKEESHIKVYVTDTGTITATNGTDIFTNVTVNGVSNTSHGHTSGQIIKFGGTLPVGILANTNYYIRDVTATTFKVELSVGGGVVNITTDGSSLTWTRVTTKTLGTDYTVAISTSNVATVSWMSGKRPLNNVKFYFAREVPYSQTTDLLNNSLIEAESLENQLDLIVNQVQQVKNTTGRVLKYSDNLLSTDATEISATLDVDASSRANKTLKFDAQGNLGVSILNIDDAQDYVLEAKSYATETGVVNTYEGTVATATSPPAYSSKKHATDSAASASTASTKAGEASSSAATALADKDDTKDYKLEAGDWATKVNGVVNTYTDTVAQSDGSDHSAKAWSLGGIGVTQTASKGASKEWAVGTGRIDNQSSGGYSSKEHATGSTVAEGSSKQWALGGGSFVEGTAVTGSSYSAKKYASDASSSASTASGHSSDAEGFRDTASTHASTATTKAGEASTSAGTASTHAGTATTQAGTATTQAGIATTKAGEASTSAGEASTSATNSANSATASASSANISESVAVSMAIALG